MSHWYHFNKRERNGIFVLLIILIGMIIYYMSMPFFYDKLHVDTKLDSLTIATLREFDSTRIAKQALWDDKRRKDSIKRRNRFNQAIYKPPKSSSLELKEIKLKPFNPNNSSIEELRSLGLSSWLAQRVVKYQSKGGKFKIKADLKRIYGFPDSLYSSIEKYILLPDTFENNRSNIKDVSDKREALIDLNNATATELQKIRGIGPAYSKRIVKYREKLGGYIRLNQLNEVYGLSDSLVFELTPQLIVEDSNSILKININSASLRELNAHPYITYRMAADWIEYREKNGNFTSVDQLLTSGLLNESLYAKIVAYIRVQ